MAVFDQVSYAFEKIFEEVGRDSAFILSRWSVEHLQKSLDEFDRLLKARGLSIDTYDSVEYLYDRIKHPLAELTKFIRNEQSEIASHQSAVVFAAVLQKYFDELRNMANEIDREYASPPEPVVQPK